MSAPIFNRDGQAPSDGWYQIEVTGEHPAGKGRKQVIDEKALDSMLNRFAQDKTAAGANWAGLLVDADHLSHDLENPTEAFAWAQELRVNDGQLEARLDLTDLGEPAIRNKRYKFFSTEYDPEDLEDLGDGRVRPLRLAGLAFTNRPNNRGGRPISNRADSPEEKPTPTTQPMKSIAEKLGLSADADEAAILAKVTALMAENLALKGKQDEDEADKVLNRFGKRIPDAAKPLWRERLIKNRADTEALMDATIPAATAPAPRIHNRAAKVSPTPVEGQESEAGNESKRNELVDSIRNRRQCSFGEAWNAARAEKPELFN